jgi:hypothetical protein
MRLLLRLVVLAVAAGGCRPPILPNHVTFEPQPRAAGRAHAPVEPAILSAHLGGQSEILVVFSQEVDAASLEANGFLVAFAEGTRVFPREAVLSPSNESDENRTVLLIGDFEDPQGQPPSDVMVVGSLYTENGTKLQGVAAPVTPSSTAGVIVLAQRLQPPRGVCAGAAQAVRTYWIDGLRDVDGDDLARIDVMLDDANTVHPIAFDDHRLEDESREDNVLDLCIAEPSPAQRVTIAAEAFTDPGGHPTARVEEPVVSAEPEP